LCSDSKPAGHINEDGSSNSTNDSLSANDEDAPDMETVNTQDSGILDLKMLTAWMWISKFKMAICLMI
jgi:hypothetical protein